MTASTPPTLQEEMALLDDIEQALVALTTAALTEPPGRQRNDANMPAAPCHISASDPVIPAQAGTHTASKASANTAPTGHGPRPAPG